MERRQLPLKEVVVNVKPRIQKDALNAEPVGQKGRYRKEHVNDEKVRLNTFNQFNNLASAVIYDLPLVRDQVFERVLIFEPLFILLEELR